MVVGVELRDSGTDGARETAAEIKNSQTISVGNRER